AAIRAEGPLRPLVTVVTDLIDFHLGWACPKANLIVVPTVAAREVVIGHGVESERVKLLGLPVDLRFRPPAPGEKAALRRRFGIKESLPTLLVTAGGDGTGGLLRQVRALADRPYPWQLLVVCGNNQRIHEQLSKKDFPTPTKVFGFVENMPELMRASDLVISKAGPGAIAEALATGLPMVITTYLPGQETANVRFVTETGFGVYTPKPELLLKTVENLFTGDRKQLESMANLATDIARPYAALDVARICIEMTDDHRH
ncbi:MAG: glycosyltransferase, partial [Candidatus Dormibacteraceae bacterium]